MTDPIIDALPTQAERDVARKIVAILEPFTPEKRRKLIEQALARVNATSVKDRN